MAFSFVTSLQYLTKSLTKPEKKICKLHMEIKKKIDSEISGKNFCPEEKTQHNKFQYFPKA